VQALEFQSVFRADLLGDGRRAGDGVDLNRRPVRGRCRGGCGRRVAGERDGADGVFAELRFEEEEEPV
jgi:hypothetical protein